MPDKPKTPPTDAEISARALGRWENEGGTTPPRKADGRKPSKRPRDANQLAKLVVDMATGDDVTQEQTLPTSPNPDIPKAAAKARREL